MDKYSYNLGVIDSFCEMVAAGLKTLAMSHPCDTKEERDSYLEDMKSLCEKYEILYYEEDEAFVTDLFPAELNSGKYYYLFFRTEEVLAEYMQLKEMQRRLIEDGGYTKEKRYEIAVGLGRLLSYPEDGIERLIRKAQK